MLGYSCSWFDERETGSVVRGDKPYETETMIKWGVVTNPSMDLFLSWG